jgi:hypothetical protein
MFRTLDESYPVGPAIPAPVSRRPFVVLITRLFESPVKPIFAKFVETAAPGVVK